jgi:hypothetical protein
MFDSGFLNGTDEGRGVHPAYEDKKTNNNRLLLFFRAEALAKECYVLWGEGDLKYLTLENPSRSD